MMRAWRGGLGSVALALVCAGCRAAVPTTAAPTTLQDQPIPNPPVATHRAAPPSPMQGKLQELIGASRRLRDSIEHGAAPAAPEP